MPLVAQGPAGLIDATLADSGSAAWKEIYRARPRVQLTCPACGGCMHAKVSPRGLRFFAHDASRRVCPLNGETPDHRLLKSAIAAAVRLAGWHAALEAAAPAGKWRADVLATAPDGSRRVAWEAQLARQHDDDTRARTDRYIDDGVEVVWLFDRLTPADLPAVTVDVDQNSIRVAGPVARLHVDHCAPGRCDRYGDLQSQPRCPGHCRWERACLTLDQFVNLVCEEAIVRVPLPDSQLDTRPDKTTTGGHSVNQWWTSPVYLQRARSVRRAQQDADAKVAGQRARLRRQREKEVERRLAEAERLALQAQKREANIAALLDRQRLLEPVVIRQVTGRAGTRPWALPGDYEHAMGISILIGGRVVAVICPIASRITPEIATRLSEVTVYVASERERRALARLCNANQRFIVVPDLSP